MSSLRKKLSIGSRGTSAIESKRIKHKRNKRHRRFESDTVAVKSDLDIVGPTVNKKATGKKGGKHNAKKGEKQGSKKKVKRSKSLRAKRPHIKKLSGAKRTLAAPIVPPREGDSKHNGKKHRKAVKEKRDKRRREKAKSLRKAKRKKNKKSRKRRTAGVVVDDSSESEDHPPPSPTSLNLDRHIGGNFLAPEPISGSPPRGNITLASSREVSPRSKKRSPRKTGYTSAIMDPNKRHSILRKNFFNTPDPMMQESESDIDIDDLLSSGTISISIDSQALENALAKTPTKEKPKERNDEVDRMQSIAKFNAKLAALQQAGCIIPERETKLRQAFSMPGLHQIPPNKHAYTVTEGMVLEHKLSSSSNKSTYSAPGLSTGRLTPTSGGPNINFHLADSSEELCPVRAPIAGSPPQSVTGRIARKMSSRSQRKLKYSQRISRKFLGFFKGKQEASSSVFKSPPHLKRRKSAQTRDGAAYSTQSSTRDQLSGSRHPSSSSFERKRFTEHMREQSQGSSIIDEIRNSPGRAYRVSAAGLSNPKLSSSYFQQGHRNSPVRSSSLGSNRSMKRSRSGGRI